MGGKTSKIDLSNLDTMQVADLRAELLKRGLDAEGEKDVLIERLRAHLAEPKNGGGGDGK